ncbi:hypothetical protein [Providencia sneebia]|uniref:MoxR-vWA-beta-propeller ternary system domain-containing protein n=1 Tax=Providencia sneebia DSM 19967 TaxID=1141660 RepID=K8WCG1_9GAMM|nr:hypothetical protein [Providencia sneebia]EKT57596.1 hypothetical protein OO7_09445 [Providencia sneebia DSM 19967]
MSLLLSIEWQINEQPLTPEAVVAIGDSARQLTKRLADLDADNQQKLKVVTGKNWLVVIGHSNLLPWVDGGMYIAPSAQTVGLWLPTHQQPILPHSIINQALKKTFKQHSLLILPSPMMVFPLDNPWRLSSPLLGKLLEKSFI